MDLLKRIWIFRLEMLSEDNSLTLHSALSIMHFLKNLPRSP